MSGFKDELCLICGNKSKGLHFQVLSCRACAEFFRRSIQSGKVYKCQRGTGKCDVTVKKAGIPRCRYCRFEKCKQLMKVDQSQVTSNEPIDSIQTTSKPSTSIDFYNNGVLVESVNPIASPETSTFMTSPETSTNSFDEYGIPLSPHASLIKKEKTKITIDMSKLDAKIRQIFETTNYNLRNDLTFLHQLYIGFTAFYEEIKPKGEVVVTDVFDKYTHIIYQDKFMVKLAELLMSTSEFASLDNRDKFIVFKHLWPRFFQIERHYSSIRYFGVDPSVHYVLHDEYSAINFGSDEITMKDIDTFRASMPFWIPTRDKFIKTLMNPMKALQLSGFEVCYILAQTVWSVQDVDGLSSNLLQYSEKILEQVSNDMHNYYVNDMKMPNYATRLIKLTKLIEGAKDVMDAKMEVFLIGRVFNMFHTEVINSELWHSK